MEQYVDDIDAAGGYKVWKADPNSILPTGKLSKIVGKSSVDIPWKNLDDKNII